MRRSGLAAGATPFDGVYLYDCPGFEEHESGALGDAPYLEGLARFLGLSVNDALLAQQGILDDPIPGMERLLADLLDQGVQTACLSNTNALHWPLLDGPSPYPVMGLVQRRFGSHRVGARKPSKDAYSRVQELLGKTRVAFFDDSETNVVGAKAVGWNACRVHQPGVAEQARQALLEWGILKPDGS